MKFYSCRDGAAVIPVPNSRRVELRAVMLREFLNPQRLTPIAHRGHSGEQQLKLSPNIVYVGHTGICITGAASEDFDFRATADAWQKHGLCIERAELAMYSGGTFPELLIYFTVRVVGDDAPNAVTPMFQLILPHGMPLPTTLDGTVKAPAPGIKYAADKVQPPRPAAPGRNAPAPAPGTGSINAEQAAQAWLRTPDTKGHIVSAGSAEPSASVGLPATPIPASLAAPAASEAPAAPTAPAAPVAPQGTAAPGPQKVESGSLG